jgi:hypothetical protein
MVGPVASNLAICLVSGEIKRTIRRKLASFQARRGSQGWIKGREAGTGATRSPATATNARIRSTRFYSDQVEKLYRRGLSGRGSVYGSLWLRDDLRGARY